MFLEFSHNADCKLNIVEMKRQAKTEGCNEVSVSQCLLLKITSNLIYDPCMFLRDAVACLL